MLNKQVQKAEKFGKDFAAFAIKGNVLDMAVGVIIGGAFGKIVTSLVSDILMPLVGQLTGGVDLSGAFIALDANGASYATKEMAVEAGVPILNYGLFLQSVIDFLIIALCIFIFVKGINRAFKKKEEVKTSSPTCPSCLMEVKKGATRCPHCTSELPL